MRIPILVSLIVLSFAAGARADELIAAKSTKSVKETLDRPQKVVTENGFFVVARVPHSDAAKGAGLELRPTELLIFGKPQSGTPVMVCDQRAGIDLPLRAVAWQDSDGQIWLAMVDPQVLKQRYALATDCDATLAAMAVAHGRNRHANFSRREALKRTLNSPSRSRDGLPPTVPLASAEPAPGA